MSEARLKRLSQRRTIWAPGRRPGAAFLVLVVVLVVAAVIVGHAAGVIRGFVALLLVLDRVIGFSPWGVAEAERRFAQLMAERRRAAVRRRLSSRRVERAPLDHLDEDSSWASTAQRRRLGVQEIAIDSITGTVEQEKANAFDREWRPPKWSRGHWTRMWLAAQRGTALPPISVYLAIAMRRKGIPIAPGDGPTAFTLAVWIGPVASGFAERL